MKPKMRSAWISIFLSLATICLTIACSHRSGTVLVSQPLPFERERLLEDRANEQEWLRTQFARYKEDTIQGGREQRRVSQAALSLRADLDPLGGQFAVGQAEAAAKQFELQDTLASLRAKQATVGLNSQEQQQLRQTEYNQAALQQQLEQMGRVGDIRALQGKVVAKQLELREALLEQQLEQLRAATPTEQVVEEGSETGEEQEDSLAAPNPLDEITTAALPELTATPAVTDVSLSEITFTTPSAPTFSPKVDLPDNFYTGRPSLPTAGLELSSVKPLAIEQLDDRLAYRNRVRAELRKNMLDDQHDLGGYTLHALELPITVIPGDDTRSRSKRSGIASDPAAHVWFLVSSSYDSQIYHQWANSIRRRIHDEVIAAQRRISTTSDLTRREWDMMLMHQLNINDMAVFPITMDSRERAESYSAAQWFQGKRFDIAAAGKLYDKVQSHFNIKKQDFVYLITSSPKPDALQRHIAWVYAKYYESILGDYIDINTQYSLVDKVSVLGTMYHVPKVAKKPSAITAFLDRLDPRGQGVTASKRDEFIAAKKEFELKTGRLPQFRSAYEELNATDNYQLFIKRVREILSDDLDSTQQKSLLALEKKLHEYVQTLHTNQVRVYAVEPRELAQSISDVAARSEFARLNLAAQAAAPGSGLGIGGAVDLINESQERLHALLRNPLVIGYGNGGQHFGWYLGPRYVIEGDRPAFRHAPTPRSMRVILAVPGWHNQILLQHGHDFDPDSFTKPLDRDRDVNPDSTLNVFVEPNLDAVTEMLLGDHVDNPRSPSIVEPTRPMQFRAGQSETIVIRGQHLWRSPTVYVGSQRASSVTVHPDMGGITATFGVVRMPTHSVEQLLKVDLRVITAYGDIVRPSLIHILDADTPIAKPVKLVKRLPNAAIEDAELKLIGSGNLVPTDAYRVSFRVRSKADMKNDYWSEWQPLLGAVTTKVTDKATVFSAKFDTTDEVAKDLRLVEVQAQYQKHAGGPIVEVAPPVQVVHAANPSQLSFDSTSSTLNLSITHKTDQAGNVTKTTWELDDALVFKFPEPSLPLLHFAYPRLASEIKSGVQLQVQLYAGNDKKSARVATSTFSATSNSKKSQGAGFDYVVDGGEASLALWPGLTSYTEYDSDKKAEGSSFVRFLKQSKQQAYAQFSLRLSDGTVILLHGHEPQDRIRIDIQ